MSVLSLSSSKVFGESNYEDQEQDANSALIELDKGLRSGKPGELCEAVMKFPALFEKYPFPILINSAFLKLADVFRMGTNFQRLCILKVTQQSTKHLEKVLNVDEFVRPIFSVIHSNDPVARAMTLRVLGSMASIISERKSTHHSVITSLDSHDSVELEAAIFATAHFAEQSKTFASSACQKLFTMIKGLATPVEIKLKLLPIFQHMHHEADVATRVRQFCTDLLTGYPAKKVVTVTLHTLSLLTAKSLINISQQVDLLLAYLVNDPRAVVKTTTLNDLRLLANKAPHMWTSTNVDTLCNFVLKNHYNGLKIGALTVLTTLSKSIAVNCVNTKPGSPAMTVCSQCCYDNNLTVASVSTAFLTHLAVHARKVSLSAPPVCQEASTALEALVVLTAMTDSADCKKGLKTTLQSIVSLCKGSPELARSFIDTITTLLLSAPADSCILLCECLAALGCYYPDAMQMIMPEIDSLLQAASQNGNQDLVVTLCTLVFQATEAFELPPDKTDSLLNLALSLDPWKAYKIGRQAARYGHHPVAAKVFSELATKVSTEHFLYWLSGLTELCQGEQCLQQISDPQDTPSIIKGLTQAAVHFHKGLSSLKAAGSPSCPLLFQCEMARLRVQLLHACGQLFKACCSFRTSPPPAIAATLAMTTGQEILKSGRIVGQLQQCGEEFEKLFSLYGNLYQSSFDADTESLQNLQLLQHGCLLMSQCIQAVLNSGSRGSQSIGNIFEFSSEDMPSQNQRLLDTYQDIVKDMRQLVQMSSAESAITFQHINFLQKCASGLIQVPLHFPRYFFQSLQQTSIKLAISPQPKTANEPISIEHETHLTLKVEGIIQHGQHPGLFRKIKDVKVNVCSVMTSRGHANPDMKVTENPPNDMYTTTSPNNDYFSTQFLLAFPVPGIHAVQISVSVTDQDGTLWKTGPQTSINVKSYDESYRIKQQQAAAQHRAQQRAAAFSQQTH